MKYYIVEGTPDGAYNAATKAREDVEKILVSQGIEKFYIPSIYGVQKNKLLKWKQFFVYRKNKKIWDKALSSLNSGDVLYLQYPILNATTKVADVIKKYREKGIKFVAIIHDMDSLRINKEESSSMLYKRVCYEDKYVLNEMDYIICHNSSMKKELVKLGNDFKNLIELKIFDYLLDFEPKKFKRTKNDPVIIAGNLSPDKAKYLSDIKKLNVKFNLFGVGFNDQVAGKNIKYKGKFKPDELLNHLEGGFGLVWDGKSINTIEGGFGNYLRYNNPHKVSLYLTAGIPVIVWKESALADYIEKNHLGIAVNNLNEIEKKINNLSNKEYNEICDNIKAVSKKLKNGEFLKEALNKIK